MDKSEFKDSLTNGRCKCGGNPALSEPLLCPVGHMQGTHSHSTDGLCECCDACRRKCLRISDQVDKAFTDMSKRISEGIDAEIIDHLKQTESRYQKIIPKC